MAKNKFTPSSKRTITIEDEIAPTVTPDEYNAIIKRAEARMRRTGNTILLNALQADSDDENDEN